VSQDLWSLRPTALLETLWLHLFGNYFDTEFTSQSPWMALMFTEREPFFFSIYLGVPLLALSIFGLAGDGTRRWRLFWVTAGLASLIAALGAYTPIYPVLRDHVPIRRVLRELGPSLDLDVASRRDRTRSNLTPAHSAIQGSQRSVLHSGRLCGAHVPPSGRERGAERAREER